MRGDPATVAARLGRRSGARGARGFRHDDLARAAGFGFWFALRLTL